ncbi:MAG: DUF4340 domain-containing protein [Patescibacteria group bacterium]|nr:DUF4340 domain-containing protein [Patescibacteria group bacterium]
MNKKNLILGGILIILVALAYFYQGPLEEWRAGLNKPDNFLTQINVNQIDKIKVTKSGEITILEKQGDKWKIGGTKNFYVKNELANSLTSDLKKIIGSKVELASANKDKKGDFQTDQESGVIVKLSQNDEIMADFVVGKRGIDFTSAYVSEPISDNTYIFKANIYNLFNRDDWYDKTIFSSDKKKISKIRFQYPNREFTIASADTETIANKDIAEDAGSIRMWEGILPYKFSVNKEKVDEILDIMSNLTAVKIPEQTFENTGLKKNLIIIQAAGEDIDNTLMIGEADENGLYYAKKADSDNIYLITKEQRDELNKKIRDLR